MKPKHISLMISLVLISQLITPALALDISTAGNNGTAIVPATIQATTLSVTVPTQLPVEVDSTGSHTYATDAKITNGSSGPIVVSNIAMTAQNGWSLASYDTDMAKEPVGTKKLGFNINGSTTQQGESNLAGVKSNFGAIIAGGNQHLDYSAVLPTQSEALDKVTAAQVIFTVDWYTGGNSTAESEQGLLALDKETIQMLPGTKESISVTYQETPSLIQLMALEDEIQWSSSNTSIAKVDSGVVEAQSTGNAVITAKAGDLVASCNVIVNEPWVPITAVGFSKHSTTIVNGSNETVLLLYNPEKFSGTADLAVTSSDSTVASVTPTSLNGVTASDGPTAIQINGLKAGKAVITATATSSDGAVSDTITVNITEPLKGIEVTGDTTVKVGETISLTANKIPANTTDTGVITWSSSDTSIATVDNNGVVTGVAEGTISITASCSMIKDTVSLDIVDTLPPLNATEYLDKSKMKTALRMLVGNITFSTRSPIGKSGIDISENGDNSILAVINGQDAIIYSDGGCLAPADSSKLFYGYFAKTINIQGLGTSDVTDMSYMFSGCSQLVSLNIEALETSNVNNMYRMFQGCSRLTAIGLHSFDTSKVTNMGEMFGGCINLVDVDLSSFNTSNVTEMGAMLFNCRALKTIDLSNFITDKVTGINMMFQGCSSLSSIDLSNFNISNILNVAYVCMNCDKLDTIYVKTQEDLEKLKAIADIPEHTELKLKPGHDSEEPELHAVSILNKAKMDNALSELTGRITFSTKSPERYTGVDISEDGDNSIIAVVNGQDAIIYANGGCIAPVDSSYLFNTVGSSYNGYKAKNLDLRGLDTSKVTDMNNMFTNCRNLTFIDLRNFDTSKVVDMHNMFTNCAELMFINLSSFNTSNVTNMKSLLYGCSSLASIDLNTLDVAKVTNISYMISYCSKLKSVDLSNFDTANISDLDGIFMGCYGLKEVYARTQADASKLSSSVNKPSNVTITVKAA